MLHAAWRTRAPSLRRSVQSAERSAGPHAARCGPGPRPAKTKPTGPAHRQGGVPTRAGGGGGGLDIPPGEDEPPVPARCPRLRYHLGIIYVRTSSTRNLNPHAPSSSVRACGAPALPPSSTEAGLLEHGPHLPVLALAGQPRLGPALVVRSGLLVPAHAGISQCPRPSWPAPRSCR